MSVGDDKKRDEIRRMIAKGKRVLDSARNMFADGDFEGACSRAYYAVFHLMQAALFERDMVFSKHSGVTGTFFKEFVKSGTFPREYAKIIKRLQENREVGDYSYHKEIPKEVAKEDVIDAETVVNAITDYLVRRGF
ncbi:MAG: hypothetical protein DRP79_02545 [Planctomycetota bacterium]|nr:MAG: hypothetical protein DRP79_02545 [Planctomycetota bacterium]